MRTGAVITAAGMSSRMGQFKPLLELGSMSFVKRTIANFRQSGVDPIVLVTGYNAGLLEKHVSGENVLCVYNPEYASTEMLDSVRIGLSYIAEKCERTFCTPVDTPLFRSATVDTMMDVDADVVRPVHDGHAGHPVLFRNALIETVSNGSATDGLRGILRSLAERTRFVEVKDPGILLDADTPEDYRELAQYHSTQLFRPEVEVRLLREQQVLDRRTALLLRVISYDGTVKDACRKLGISYRKAWNMIAEAEAALGCSLVERRAGGEYGGTSVLTARGREFLDCYEKFADRVAQHARECFAECFDSFSFPSG